MASMKRDRRRFRAEAGRPDDPYVEMWRALTPAERLDRAWRLRTRLRNIRAIHDAKTYPQL